MNNYLRMPPLLALTAMLLLMGCATTRAADEVADPLEEVNRAIYDFNEAADEVVLEPVATAYQNNVPQAVRTGVSNFFSNLSYPIVIVNNVLQGKVPQAVNDTGRFVINSTVGVLGIFDVASALDLEANDEDFGQTLGVWGVGDGIYLVLPLFGPSTLRDTVGLGVDYNLDILNYVSDVPTRNGLRAVKAVDVREGLLRAGRILDEAALDPYSFVREAYLQRRINLIYDGNPPEELLEDEFLDEDLLEDDLLEDDLLEDDLEAADSALSDSNNLAEEIAAPLPAPGD